jgi:hypothetical protein
MPHHLLVEGDGEIRGKPQPGTLFAAGASIGAATGCEEHADRATSAVIQTATDSFFMINYSLWAVLWNQIHAQQSMTTRCRGGLSYHYFILRGCNSCI